ncbi:MAG TPA: tetratricopeptide repeat protein [Candidatus Eisenbacteria bacterium]|nr:tetratricopeptide repeat protein [Candidatus Eisenbacteria bacterium]
MSQPTNTFTCPRCGERLPAGFTRCDACGAYIVPSSGGHGGLQGAQQGGQQGGGARQQRPQPKHAPQSSAGLPPWAFLVIGLIAGGAVGYALRTAVTPQMEGGAPRGPADVMGGGDMGGDPMGGGMGGGAMGAPGGMQQTQMLPQVIEALAKYRNTLASDPTNVEANVGMGNLMFDSGKWDKAIEHYSAALEKDPKNPDVRVDRAIAYHSIGQDAQALDDLKRVTRENPTHKNAWLNLGVVAGAMGDNKTNIAAWEQYLKLDPSGQHSDAIKSELAKLK